MPVPEPDTALLGSTVPGPRPPAVPGGAIAAGVATGFAVAAGALLLARQMPASDAHPLRALLAYGLLVTVVFGALAALRPSPVFGPANTVTLLRAGLACLLAALIGEDWTARAGWVAGLATVALALDGVDGWLARRHGPSTAFGARFDMEADALFGLVLALLAWRAGLAGPWVLAVGLWRYAFIAAAGVLPWLARPLPPSRRRKLFCVLHLVALIACIAPVFPPPVRSGCALLALLLVSTSFVIDIGWLGRHRHDPAWRRAAASGSRQPPD